MAILSIGWGVLNAVWDLLEEVYYFALYRDDWNRRWSPVSFYLAVFSALILLVMILVYGSEAWTAIKSALS